MQPQPGLIYVRFMGMPAFVDAFDYPEIFDNCCAKADAEALLKLFPPGCVLADFKNRQPFTVMFADPTMGLGWFQISGTDAANLPIDEDCGDLLDRQRNPDGPMQDVPNGVTIGFHDFPQEQYCAAYWATGAKPAIVPVNQSAPSSIHTGTLAG